MGTNPKKNHTQLHLLSKGLGWLYCGRWWLWLVVLGVWLSLFRHTSSHSSPAKEREAELQKIFQLRKEDEWKNFWHSEKHARCRDQLLSHMEWACQKDIYRLDKKNEGDVGLDVGDMFLPRRVAFEVVVPSKGYRRKRENKSITDECCKSAGCTWEEYAEYCPAHRRARNVRSRRTRK